MLSALDADFLLWRRLCLPSTGIHPLTSCYGGVCASVDWDPPADFLLCHNAHFDWDLQAGFVLDELFLFSTQYLDIDLLSAVENRGRSHSLPTSSRTQHGTTDLRCRCGSTTPASSNNDHNAHWDLQAGLTTAAIFEPPWSSCVPKDNFVICVGDLPDLLLPNSHCGVVNLGQITKL